MEVINLPYRYTILIWRVVSSRFLTMDAIKIYIGSAGPIPARQIEGRFLEKQDHKLLEKSGANSKKNTSLDTLHRLFDENK